MALILVVNGGEIQLSGNPIWIVVTGANIPAGASDYKILLQITSTDGHISGGPFCDAKTPDGTGSAIFDISGYLNIPTIQEFEWPAQGVIVPHPPSILSINIQCGESYIDSNGSRVTTIDGEDYDMQILKGGLSEFEIAENMDESTNFYTNWILEGKFLTNQPDNMIVSPNQINKLWFLGRWSSNHLCTLVTEFNTNNKVGHLPIRQDFEIYTDTGLIEININKVLQGFTTDPGEEIASIEVYIEDEFGDASEHRTFIVDNEHHENNNYLLVANSKGGIDVLWLSGEVKTSLDTEGTEGYKPLGLLNTSKKGTILATSRSARKKWVVNTGWKSKEEMIALADVYLAYNLWLYIDGKLRPVILKNGEKLLSDSFQDLHYAELELLEAHHARFA